MAHIKRMIRAVILGILGIGVFITPVKAEELHLEDRKTIFIGDSRTVGMGKAVNENNVHFIAKVGSGYNWLKKTAIKELDAYINEVDSDDVVIVFNHGINDPGNIDKYTQLYEDIALKYGKYSLYLMSVNPCDGSYIKKGLNEKATGFNDKLKKIQGFKYIDISSVLVNTGFSTSDGLHYTNDTYSKIYGLADRVIGASETSKLGIASNKEFFKASSVSVEKSIIEYQQLNKK